MAQQSTIPHSRLGRFAKLGGLATSLAGNLLYEGSKTLLSGNKPVIADLVLSSKNANKIAEKLSEMRGAAMKVGQLLSMDVGYLLPREVSEVFSRLRNDAHQMPMMQIAEVMEKNQGSDWQSHYQRFKFTPIASASIGQVHIAELKDGRQVAIKLQYPGVKESIDSDIDNIAMLLNLFKMIPADVDIAPLIEDARLQLHAEADYKSEAAFLNEFSHFIENDDRFEVAEVIEELSNDKILTTSFLDGEVIDKLYNKSVDVRHNVTSNLLELSLREVFQFGIVQTDSNFANYLYSENTGKIQLLDFGATRRYSQLMRNQFMVLLNACLTSDKQAVLESAYEIGYTSEDDNKNYQDAIVDLILTVTMPICHEGEFDFRHSQLSQLMTDKLMKLRFEQRYTRLPPTDILFLHRKLGGLYLLLSHLGANLNVNQLVRHTLL
jgi:predicted unusual protein kinase regulating ubiquinone biosynthesis (AarF/ABC1/UbiB family)